MNNNQEPFFYRHFTVIVTVVIIVNVINVIVQVLHVMGKVR